MHADYPLAPERRITDDELSPFARQLWKKLKKEDKLPPRTAIDKTHYKLG